MQPEQKQTFRKQVTGPLKKEVVNSVKYVSQQLVKLLKYLPVAAYFWSWSYKTSIRHKLKKTALGIISVSSILLILEVIMEWKGGKKLHDWIVALDFTGSMSWIGPASFVHPHNILRALFIAAVVYLVWHHYSESKKPGYEYSFVKQVNQFMRKRLNCNSEEVLVPFALPLFLKIFQQSKAVRCSIFKLEGDILVIPDSYVYPKIMDDSYKLHLGVGEGVAGLVFKESIPLYVPRLYFPFAKRWRWTPSLFFPHAVGFDAHEENGVLEMVNDSLKTKAFKKMDGIPPFHSIVSVPVKSSTGNGCYGVLSFDFAKNDPLDKSEVAMASVLGLLLGDEIARLQSAVRH